MTRRTHDDLSARRRANVRRVGGQVSRAIREATGGRLDGEPVRDAGVVHLDLETADIGPAQSRLVRAVSRPADPVEGGRSRHSAAHPSCMVEVLEPSSQQWAVSSVEVSFAKAQDAMVALLMKGIPQERIRQRPVEFQLVKSGD